MSTPQEKIQAVEHAIGVLKSRIQNSKEFIAKGEDVEWHRDNIKRAEEIIKKGEALLPANNNTHPPHEEDEAW